MLRFMNETPYLVEIKSREELIKLGYKNNYDLFDFLNLLAGKTVTIVEKSEDGKILISKEFPEYAIYDIAIEKKIEIKPLKYELDFKELSLLELSDIFNVTPQRISQICQTALKKISKIAASKKEDLLSFVC